MHCINWWTEDSLEFSFIWAHVYSAVLNTEWHASLQLYTHWVTVSTKRGPTNKCSVWTPTVHCAPLDSSHWHRSKRRALRARIPAQSPMHRAHLTNMQIDTDIPSGTWLSVNFMVLWEQVGPLRGRAVKRETGREMGKGMGNRVRGQGWRDGGLALWNLNRAWITVPSFSTEWQRYISQTNQLEFRLHLDPELFALFKGIVHAKLKFQPFTTITLLM